MTLLPPLPPYYPRLPTYFKVALRRGIPFLSSELVSPPPSPPPSGDAQGAAGEEEEEDDSRLVGNTQDILGTPHSIHIPKQRRKNTPLTPRTLVYPRSPKTNQGISNSGSFQEFDASMSPLAIHMAHSSFF